MVWGVKSIDEYNFDEAADHACQHGSQELVHLCMMCVLYSSTRCMRAHLTLTECSSIESWRD